MSAFYGVSPPDGVSMGYELDEDLAFTGTRWMHDATAAGISGAVLEGWEPIGTSVISQFVGTTGQGPTCDIACVAVVIPLLHFKTNGSDNPKKIIGIIFRNRLTFGIVPPYPFSPCPQAWTKKVQATPSQYGENAPHSEGAPAAHKHPDHTQRRREN